MSRHVEERKRELNEFIAITINIVLVEQTSQKVNKTLCIRSSTETKRKNKRPIGVTKTGNRDEKTGPKILGGFAPDKIAPHMARLGIFSGTFSPKLRQNAHFCAPGKTLINIDFLQK